MTPDSDDLSAYSMMDLFRLEAKEQIALLTQGLLALEAQPERAATVAPEQLETLMRTAHSLKGAARMVGLNSAVRVAHAMEDCFVAAQKTQRALLPAQVDVLLRGVDIIERIAAAPEADAFNWEREHAEEIEQFLQALSAAQNAETPTVETSTVETPTTEAPAIEVPIARVPTSEAPVAEAPTAEAPVAEAPAAEASVAGASVAGASVAEVPVAGKNTETQPAETSLAEAKNVVGETGEASSQAVRVSAEHLNQMLGLAGETVVASRWLDAFAAELTRLKRLQNAVSQPLQGLRESLLQGHADERSQDLLAELQDADAVCRDVLTERLAELELFNRRFANLSQRLYQEVLDSRMRPFADGIGGLPRMVRDIARELGKEVRLEIQGESTPVDRDILEHVEAPLRHLLRNALDHGIGTPDERERAGKPRAGIIRLEARHRAGRLLITVADDGRGIDLESVRAAVVRRGLADAAVAAQFSEAELLEFLFLPGFTLKEAVTELSGRGVGLDVVQTMVKEAGGGVHISPLAGGGVSFQLQLPLTLSVLRTLLVEIAGETYAFPLARVSGALKLSGEEIQSIEGRRHFTAGDGQVGLVTAHQLLDVGDAPLEDAGFSVVVLGDKTQRYGVVVDRFLGERELVVRALDPRLGKIQGISAAALLPDQTPVLIVDVEDLLSAIEKIISGGRLAPVGQSRGAGAETRKRVLVVDDSLTVRELERKLIESRGYEVETAVDGMDGWNAVRTGRYDLVVTDVDMPRLDGIELVALIKKEPKLQALPVLIVSYKDREEDRRRGLDAGADYYLTKGSFHDETLLQAVEDLIGEAEE